MKCQKYGKRQDSGCPRNARWVIDGQHLCNSHAQQRPLEIVQSDTAKWRNWIKVDLVPEGQQCQQHRGCVHKYGNHSTSDEAGPAVITVDGGKPLCRYHAGEAVWGEVLFGQYLPKLIEIKDYRDENDDEHE